MKFTLDPTPTLFKINAVRDHSVTINDVVYEKSVLILKDAIQSPWINDWNMLSTADFASVIAAKPQVFLLGTGAKFQFLPASLEKELRQQGVRLEVMDTKAACRTYIALASEGRDIACALWFV